MTTNNKSLEAQLVAQCFEHDLVAVSLAVYMRPDGSWFYGAVAHWDDLTTGKVVQVCRQSKSDHLTLNKALADAIGKVHEARTKPVSVPTLAPMGE